MPWVLNRESVGSVEIKGVNSIMRFGQGKDSSPAGADETCKGQDMYHQPHFGYPSRHEGDDCTKC